MQKIEMIKAISRNLRDLVVDSVPASLTGSTVDVLKLIHPNAKQLQGKHFFIYEGGGFGQSRIVGTLDTANRRIYFTEGFTTVPSTNSKFVIFDEFDIDDYKNAFDLSYHRLYHIRTNIRDEWAQWVSGITQKQAQWKNEKQAEIDAWVTNKDEEQDAWHAQQVDWELGLSAEWASNISKMDVLDAFNVPSLHIHVPGTLSIGTVPVGSLHIPTLSLMAVPSIDTIPSYSSVVLDEPLLFMGIEQNLLDSLVDKEGSWQNRRDSVQSKYDTTTGQEKEMLTNLIEVSNRMWADHKQQLDSTWEKHKERYEKNFGLLQASYEQHKADKTANWTNLKTIYGTPG